MTEFNSFSTKASGALNDAMKTAMNMGHIYIGSEHILCGLLSVNKSVAAYALSSQGVTRSEVAQKIESVIGKGIPTKLGVKDFTPRSRQILEDAVSEARTQNKQAAGSEHLLRAIIKDPNCYATVILRDLGVNLNSLYNSCGKTNKANLRVDEAEDTIYSSHNGEKGKNGLKKYGRDLTALALQQRLDPVIFRDEEIDRVIQVLLRRRKNNPCLVGESGVGKTAVAEGLALRIANNTVPDIMKDKKIFLLDLPSMLAGAKYRGDFEDRVKNTLDEIIRDGNIILFLDEIHTIIGAGAAEGAIDAANILKPLLARGELQLIGATTIEEYRRYIEKDAALERRFQPITVEEPNEEAAKKILNGLRERYEDFHKVSISDEAIDAAVSLSARYVNNRFLPDKAIDLIDEAASKLRLEAYAPCPLTLEIDEKLKNIEENKIHAINSQNFEKAALLRDEEEELLKQKEELEEKRFNGKSFHGTVTAENISEIISKWTGIPTSKIEETEMQKLLSMEDFLKGRVLGQEEAVNAVSKAIRRGRAGLKNPGRPIGSFLFMGPTGVGKTELCKAMAEQLFGDDNSLIRLDMSEYMEKHAVSKLIGSPPGYIGFDEGGQLTEKIRRKPYSVLLFDEIEKAHPDIMNIMLQILEDGILTASDGRKVNFKNTVIIMTSNIGARLITDNKPPMGFLSEEKESPIKERVILELKRTFRPEFINRIDEVVVFNKLTKENVKSICEKLLDDLSNRAKTLGFTLRFSDEVVERLTALGFDNKFGARPLRRVITAKIEDMLSRHLLEGTIKGGDSVIINLKNDEFYPESN